MEKDLLDKNYIKKFINIIDNDFIPNLKMKSINPSDPIKVEFVPKPWILLGCGNYAGVFTHPDFDNLAIKIYASERDGLREEIEVYKTIGEHPAYSKLLYSKNNYLILKRLKGITFYNSLIKGIKIPKHIIKDIDNALEYARKKGLNPHDVHAKNVMIVNNRGVVVDISDFKHKEYCCLWHDFKKAYYKLYIPFVYKLDIPIPNFVLDTIRRMYKRYKGFSKYYAK
ncbi:TPA: serine/threonine protein kinase [Clostridium botulinum]|uniref:serine/threonine protein kinase n=1 Tax=Clostridium botulinum TaxID=1491 RepID=UPI00099B4E05|nr:serine/threonine protein kinase [Clostridium botulinum]OPD37218.1 serine/threonine protein kinase [Clostridium botulinum]PSM03373.1 serine/threonine protein kinase [Clostridium botulinum]HDK7138517.1 serine/threonine protein kinase [Clostridium botulinum]HDK7141846.1 serine/threonine protein kinase [Clostridium botulinum]HDK7146338.1 serine/threonine protein kinase [Clostridium botulinum]